MSQTNRKYKRLEALLSEARPVQPDPVIAPAKREVDELKAQVAELEEKLAVREPAQNPIKPVPVREPVARYSRRDVPKAVGADREVPMSMIGSQKQLASWMAGIFMAVSLAFSSLFAFNFFIAQKGQADQSDKFLLPLLLFMLGSSLISFSLIRREQLTRGVWLLFLANVIIPAIVAILVLAGVGGFAFLYIVVLSAILIARFIPEVSRHWALLTVAVSILAIAAVEFWNPDFRMVTTSLSRFSVVVTVLAALALLAFFIQQAILGNIRTKLITAFVVVAVFSMGVVAFLADRSLRANLTADIVDNQEFLATSQGFQIGQAVNSQIDKLKGLAAISSIQEETESIGLKEVRPTDLAEVTQLNLDWRAMVAARNTDNPIYNPLTVKVLYNPLSVELRKFQQAFPENAEVLLTDYLGYSIASTGVSSNYYQADSLWWRLARENGQYIGQPIFNPDTKTIALDMAVPVYSNSNGEIVGVLRSTVNFNVLTDLLIEGFRGQTGYSIIYQPYDQVIKLRDLGDGKYEIVQEFAPTDLREYAKSPDTSMEFSLEGVPVLASSAPVRSYSSILAGERETALDSLDWRVVTLQEKSEALKPVDVQTRDNLILAILVSIAVIVIAYFLAQFITNPIVHLNAVAVQVATGDLTVEANVETRDEIGTLAATFNQMTSQLRNLFGSLEQRVLDRTHDLELASEVGRTITEKVANLDEMLTTAAEMIRARFDLYYTQVYLTDPAGRALVLRAGTGDVGDELLRRKHQLLIDSGSLNGQAVLQKKPVMVEDTQESASFKPNPLLPNTRSEMAVPLIVGGQVIGVLDMQSEHPGSLNETNLPAFEALAGQLAVALQNASLFAQAQEARSEVETQMRGLTEHGWNEFMNAIDRGQRVGYAYDQAQVAPLKEAALAPLPAEQAVSIPIQVTGARIGMIQLVNQTDRDLSADEKELLQATANQLAGHIENLRLLAQAEGYRADAEQALRRLTREGWDLLQLHTDIAPGYAFDLNEVRPLSNNGTGSLNAAFKQPLVVRDETIGEVYVDDVHQREEAAEIIEAVARQLSSHIENLRLSEQNEKRALEMETVADLSATTSTVLEPERLLQSVVDLTKESFGVYHAHIYLTDDERGALLLAAGAGETGQKMVAEGHAIPLDAERSLVARAVRERTSVIVNDVRADQGFLPNPLLPETRSEMAVPMIVGDKVLGVFDVQSDRVDNFTDEDANIYTTLASQVGVALQNARLYVEQAATVTQLRELDRLKSSFLANMSHELRTPLNSILGFADVILEELDGPLTDTMSNDLQLIQKNGQHLLHLINDVLDMAKIEAGRMNLNPEKFRVNEILEEVTSITSTLASEKNLSLFIEPDSDKEVEITADRTRLRQVMINLVNNSIKFTDKGRITIHALCQNEHVVIKVKDTGIGIPIDKLEEVFQEFAQVDTSTTRKAGGTGLGLPISRKLIEMHGGRLWAESSGVENEGSTFCVELPLEAQIAELAEKMER